MSESDPVQTSADPPNPQGSDGPPGPDANRPPQLYPRENLRWWIKLWVQPLLLLACGTILIVGLGVAQRLGLISTSGTGEARHATMETGTPRYICPMMCTPPQSEPGRCPVCAMELVPATASTNQGDHRSVHIDPAARRVANIRTVAVQSVQMTRSIRAIGELHYDEGTLKTIAAYVDGRVERLYADYTGVVVNRDDQLAWVYSPRLYSSQVEYLLTKKARERAGASTISDSGRELHTSARQRLIEMGMTESQIQQLEQSGQANSRLHLHAPISGTVIEKLAVEGQYIKEGQPIYKLADLSSLWLMLELFPEDAATMRFGQKVTAEVQSLPGREFAGRVAFIDPAVDPQTRTVGVRVVLANEDRLIRVGDYAKAAIEMPISETRPTRVYDPELANKWISPRHPHVIESAPGNCPHCGMELVQASELGFTDQPLAPDETLVVPRDAVLMAGNNSVLYVETQPGRFEIRRVVLGPQCGEQVVVRAGVREGEQIATRGNFLIDSQMQLAGNPSLIDPNKAQPIQTQEASSAELIAALDQLSDDDRQLAESQRICPVTRLPLGSMGMPTKVDVDGQTVFICCKGCEAPLLGDPQTHLANLTGGKVASPENQQVTAALAKLPVVDRKLARRQRVCPVADYQLGSMGKPIKVDVNGTSVFICCEGCRESLLAHPSEYLSKLSNQTSSGDTPSGNLPPMAVPEELTPQGGLPPIMPPRRIGDADEHLPVIELPREEMQ